MSEWKEYRLGDLGTFFGGVTSIKREDYGFGTPFISYKNVYKNSKIDISLIELMNVKESDILKRNCLIGDIFFTASSETPDEVAMSSVLLDSVDNLTFNGFCKRFRLHNFDILIPQYARYLFRGEDFRNSAYEYANGDVRFNISQENLSKIIIKIPDLPTQTAIAEILSSLDDKIELNNKINQELEELAQTLFKRWFIDFEFPNENGDPYKSSGGEMVDSELGEIPKGWEVKRLNEVSYCFDNKRIPLSSMERARKKGEFPYYGAASLMDFVDDYLFDGEFVLMGEDGSVMDSKGHPILQYVFGKFWVNNHAHVLKGNKISTEIILCLLRNSNISDLVTGAVQPKLNQGNMNKISIPLPQDLSIIRPVEFVISCHYDLFRQNFSETKELTTLRDTLLPKLISGELELSQIQNIP
jgi:type I restriction enzyme S subunit